MKYLKTIFYCSFFLLLNKSSNAQNIKIEKTTQHPFLIDHGRIAKFYNRNGKVTDSIEISCHTGSNSYISLFEIDTAFILIDVNGMWYYASPKTGQFYKGIWGWQDSLPEKYIGTFSYSNLDQKYILRKQDISKEKIYQLKDPTDYSGRFIKEENDSKIISSHSTIILDKPKKTNKK